MSGSRRLSTTSNDSRRSSEDASGFDSSSALILVHGDNDDDPHTSLDIPSDDNDGEQYEIFSPSSPPLSPTVVFMYMLSPYLKFGAMLLLNVRIPLKFALPLLLLFAVLSGFVRRIWYMLARYVRKIDAEDIFLDALARGRGKEGFRKALRFVARAATLCLHILLSVIYFRESVYAVRSFFPDVLGLPSKAIIMFLFAVPLLPLSITPSLASKRVIYTSWLSIAAYILWFICAAYANAHGVLPDNSSWHRLGVSWRGINLIAFTFTSPATLSLYTSLKANTPAVTKARTPIYRSFTMISLLSVVMATCFLLPLLVFASQPHNPSPQSQDLSVSRLQWIALSFQAINLLLAIPPLVITCPSLPVPDHLRRAVAFPVFKVISYVTIVLLSLVPPSVYSIMSDIVLVLAYSSTYFLPALLYVIIHTFKRPLSIVLPSRSPPSPRTSSVPPSPAAAQDELLQRKERALQQRQFRKRLMWDIGVWILLIPIGGGGIVGWCGKLAGSW